MDAPTLFSRFSRFETFTTFVTFAMGIALVAAGAVGASAQVRGPYFPPYPYGGYRVEPESNLRFKVTPKEADVYVDGYYAGTVDDFDGVFQRLHVTPGQHEIVVYLGGHRSLREKLYLSSGATRTIEGTLEPLRSDEPPEPPPVPSGEAPPPQMPPVRGGVPPRAPFPPGRLPPDAQPDRPAGRSATLVIRVQPRDAEVSVNGQVWENTSGDDRLEIQVGEGRHRIAVRKAGYQPFESEVMARRGETVPVNISLSPIPSR